VKAVGGAGDVAVSSEPRVTVSKAGGARRSVRSGDEVDPSGDDVLHRLAQLGEEASAAPADEPVAIPVIVEADPTFPPLASVKVPADVLDRVERDGDTSTAPDDGAATVLTAGTTIAGSIAASPLASTSTVAGTPSPRTSGSDPVGAAAAARMNGDASGAGSAAPAESAVSADLPTSLVVASPETAPIVAPEGDHLVGVAVASVTAPPIERTEVVPLTEPLVIPDVIPQDVPYPAPIPMAPNIDQAVAVDESTGMTLPVRGLRAPMIFRRAKPRVRRVTRVVRHVDTWSVFKVALVFNVILYLVCLTSGVLLWNVAHATGTIDNIEKFFEQFGWESFEFKGGEIYRNAWTGGLFVAVGLTGFVVLMATLFNLITDLVGGIRVSVLEEEVIARPRGGRSDLTGGSPRS